jgi:hypothetical protein
MSMHVSDNRERFYTNDDLKLPQRIQAEEWSDEELMTLLEKEAPLDKV